MGNQAEQGGDVLAELQAVKARLLAVEAELAQHRRRVRARWLAAAVVLVGGAAFAQLVTFIPNQPALAAQVNSNFTYLEQWILAKVGANGQPVTMTGATTINGSATINGTGTAGLNVNGPITNNVPDVAYDVWIQGGASTATGTARNLALLGDVTNDRLVINSGVDYAAGTRVDGNFSVTGRFQPAYESSWVQVTANGNYTFNHGLGAIPSQVQLLSCGAVVGTTCTTRVVISGGSGFNDGASCINPVNMSTDTNTIYIANTGCNPWGVWVYGTGWTYTGGTPGQGYYKVLAWR